MQVTNIHSRTYPVQSDEIGRLLDSLSSRNDQLWPRHMWPPMLFDKPLSVNADGGHGPIRYYVEQYEPAKRVFFRFTGPTGFNGYHEYEVVGHEDGFTELRNTLNMNTSSFALVSWPLIFQPLHDALIEDSLTLVEAQLGLSLRVQKWSIRVRFLRWMITRGKGRKQTFPGHDSV